jgi:hypothetical protein
MNSQRGSQRSRVTVRPKHPDPLDQAEAAARELREYAWDDEAPTQPEINVHVHTAQPSQPEIQPQPLVVKFIIGLVAAIAGGSGAVKLIIELVRDIAHPK